MALSTPNAADYSFKKLQGVGFSSASIEIFNEQIPGTTTKLTSQLQIVANKVMADVSNIPPSILSTLQVTNASFSTPSSGIDYLRTDGQAFVTSTDSLASKVQYKESTLTTYVAGDARSKLAWYSVDLKTAVPQSFTSGSDYTIQLLIRTTSGGTYQPIALTYGYFIDTDSGMVVFDNTNIANLINTSTQTLVARFYQYKGQYLSDFISPSTAALTGSFTGSFQGLFYNPDGTAFSGGGSGGVQSVISSSQGAYVSASGNNVIVSASLFQVSASTIQLTGSLTAGSQVVLTNANNSFTGSFSGSFSGISTDTISSGTTKVQAYSDGTVQISGSLIVSASIHRVTGSVGVLGAVTASLAVSTPTLVGVSALSASAGTIEVSGSLIPNTNNAFDLGSTSRAWRSVNASAITGSTARFSNGNITFDSNGNAVFANTTTASFQGKVIINDSTTVATSTKYILINSGSTSTQYGGILNVSAVSSSYGFLFRPNGQEGRWAVTSGSNWNNASDVASSTFQPIVTVTGSNVAPSAGPRFVDGGALNGYGEMYIDTSTGDIYIYTV